MPEVRVKGPYVWVTWLVKHLAGEASCEWASWFMAQHEGSSWERMPSDFDQATWVIKHTVLLNQSREEFEQEGYSVTVESQNGFILSGKMAMLAGKPDLIAKKGADVVVGDTKTGQPHPSHIVQVLIYMYALPRALPSRYKDVTITGRVIYPDHVVEVPAKAVDEQFISALSGLMHLISAGEPPPAVPSFFECRFCPITSVDCPVRIDKADDAQGKTDDF